MSEQNLPEFTHIPEFVAGFLSQKSGKIELAAIQD
jgi:hypothetical protein